MFPHPATHPINAMKTRISNIAVQTWGNLTAEAVSIQHRIEALAEDVRAAEARCERLTRSNKAHHQTLVRLRVQLEEIEYDTSHAYHDQ